MHSAHSVPRLCPHRRPRVRSRFGCERGSSVESSRSSTRYPSAAAARTAGGSGLVAFARDLAAAAAKALEDEAARKSGSKLGDDEKAKLKDNLRELTVGQEERLLAPVAA
mgnify:CR=1 FL=1